MSFNAAVMSLNVYEPPSSYGLYKRDECLGQFLTVNGYCRVPCVVYRIMGGYLAVGAKAVVGRQGNDI